MQIEFKVIYAKDTEDGDVIYCTPDAEMNMDSFGPSALITGTDQIFIRDDYYDEDEHGNYAIAVNGGHIIWFEKDQKVVRLTHYSNLLNVLEMVHQGNPDMLLGPNDANTFISDMIQGDPTTKVDLLAGLDIDFSHDPEADEDDDEWDRPPKKDNGEDEDFELPF